MGRSTEPRASRQQRRAQGAASRRRAQLYLSQLRWLEGFSADGGWYVASETGPPLVVDGLALARARRTVNQLRRDHGRDLADLVGDGDSWYAATGGALDHLGRQARGEPVGPLGERLPRRVRAAALALVTTHPPLRALVEAGSSVWLLHPERLSAALAWMKGRIASLTALAAGAGPAELRRLLALVELAREEEAGVDALLALWRTDVPHPQDVLGYLGPL